MSSPAVGSPEWAREKTQDLYEASGNDLCLESVMVAHALTLAREVAEEIAKMAEIGLSPSKPNCDCLQCKFIRMHVAAIRARFGEE